MYPSRSSRASLAVTAVLLASSAAQAQPRQPQPQPQQQPPNRRHEIPRAAGAAHDEWSVPALGVRYLHRSTTVPSSIHALVVDLSVPGVRVVATPYDQRWQTVGEYASRNHVAAAINGGFWGMFQRASGVTAGGGQRWPDGEDDDETGFFAMTRARRGWISPPERLEDDVPAERLTDATSGKPMLVRDGRVDQAALDAFPYANLRHPRTAVGVSRDGRKIILIVADGRQGHSRGMTLYELSRMFIELGAFNALNLDGGGSSAMYVERVGGVVNSPSGGRWEARMGLGASREDRLAHRHASKVRTAEDGSEEVYVRGIEREVMNHIGVIAPAAPVGGAGTTSPVGSAPVDSGDPREAGGDVVLPPRQPMFHLGRAREWLYPTLLGVAIAVPVAGLGLALWWRRRRRRRAAARAAAPRTAASAEPTTAPPDLARGIMHAPA